MSYRTNVNGVQIFGNNEVYPEWIEFVISQGIEIKEDGIYSGKTTDFMGMLVAIEKIVLRLSKERDEIRKSLSENGCPEIENKYPGLFDWSYILKDINKENKDPKFDRFSFSLFDDILDLVHSGYAFMPYALFLACQDKLEEDNHFVLDGHFNCYKVKEGETISISAG